MDQHIEELKTKGYTVVPSVLSDDECEAMSNGMWDTLEYITNGDISKDDTESYKKIYDLHPLHSMLIQHYGVGHAQFVWDIRQNEDVINVFRKVYNSYFNQDNSNQNNCDDLLVSFDGISHHMPPEITGRGWFRKMWYHSDQSFVKNDFKCVQGWVTAHDVNEMDATLSVIEGTHKKPIREQFRKKFNITNKKDWYKLDDTEVSFFDNCPRVNITCPKGSLVLWDSRLLHCGKEPTKGRAESNVRQVCYVSYQPRYMATNAALKKRKKAFEELRMTNHSAANPMLFAVNPRTYGRPMINNPRMPVPALTDVGKALI